MNGKNQYDENLVMDERECEQGCCGRPPKGIYRALNRNTLGVEERR
jgi:hypothetical protein